MIRKARVVGNALDAVIQINSLANFQSLHKTKIKRRLLEVVGAIAKMKSRTKSMIKLVCLRIGSEPDEWIKDSGCSKHMMGNKSLFSTYKAYNEGNVVFGSNLKGKIIGKGCSIVAIRMDHGREFDNEVQFGAFCDAQGITHNFLAPRTPQSNGVVARLVAQGYNQQEDIDYDETYALIARLESIRILLAIACANDFKLYQLDVKSAFLNGFINEEVYVAQPPGFIDFKKQNYVYKLKKDLYGLKQASKAWYDRLKAFFLKHEYSIGVVDNTLFTKKSKSHLIIVRIYVDDIIFGSTCQNLPDDFAKIIHDEFEMSMMGELNFFLSLQIKQMEDGIFFNQSKYIKEMLKKFVLEYSKSTKTPMSTEIKLTKNDEADFVDSTKYRAKSWFWPLFRPSRIHGLPMPEIRAWLSSPIHLELCGFRVEKRMIITAFPILVSKYNHDEGSSMEVQESSHDHLHSILVSEHHGSWGVKNLIVVHELEPCSFPERFGEVQLSLVTLDAELEIFYPLFDSQIPNP
ncbi:retrovirus-related pol polyprotein from transposon TNT 1-94 [Tanacetum coccineum]